MASKSKCTNFSPGIEHCVAIRKEAHKHDLNHSNDQRQIGGANCRSGELANCNVIACCDVQLFLSLMFVSLFEMLQSIRPLWRTRRNRQNNNAKMDSSSTSSSASLSLQSSSSSQSSSSAKKVIIQSGPSTNHLSPLVIIVLVIIFLSAIPSPVSSNSNTFATFSYCSYIFNNEEKLARPERSTSDQPSDTTSAEEHNADFTVSPSSGSPESGHNRHHSHAHNHHQSRPYSQSHHRHESSSSHSHSPYPDESIPLTTSNTPRLNAHHPTHPNQAYHHSTFSTLAESVGKSRRSVESPQSSPSSSTSPSTVKPNTETRPPVTTETPSSPSTVDGLDAQKTSEPDRYFDTHHYYQHSFQHQFQFSYSPPTNSHPVYIGLEIIDVDLINDAKNFFSLQLHLFELWHEPRLNTSALQMFWATNSDPIPVNEANIADCLWTPQLVFEDSSESEQLLPPTTILLAYKNRVLLRKSRHSLKVRCHMNLQIYPMDKHLCHFKVRTFTDPVHKVDLRWLNDPDSPKRNLLDMKQNKCVIHHEDFTPSLFDIKVGTADRFNHIWLNEHYSLLDVEFIFERRIIHSLLTVYIPSSLVVTLSWLQFWFDVEAVPGRMSLGIMSTLTIMTQILTNYEKAGNHVTAVDIWLFVCLIMVFLALMEYAVAYTISHYEDGSDQMPPMWNQNYQLQLDYHKPASLQTSASDSGYKQDGEPFFSTGALRSNLFRPCPRNRRNGANLSPQQSSTTPVVDFETNNNLFKLKNLPLSPIASANSSTDPESGIASSGIKDISLDTSAAPPLPPGSPLPPNQIEDEEKSKLLDGHQQEDHQIASMPVISREHLDLARMKVHVAMQEYDQLMKQQEDNPRAILPIMPNDDNPSGGRGAGNRKRKRGGANEPDPNNNPANVKNGNKNNNQANKQKGRFASLRRPTLRRQYSSKNVERSAQGLSEVDYFSRYVFPIAFVLFVVIYWIALIYYKLTS